MPSRIARRPLVITAIAATTALIGLTVWLLWPSGLESLRDHDTNGAAACELVIKWLNGDLYKEFPEDPQGRTDALAQLTAGELVSEATTESIHATWKGGGDVETLPGLDPIPVHGVDLPGLYAACESEGVDMPPRTDVF